MTRAGSHRAANVPSPYGAAGPDFDCDSRRVQRGECDGRVTGFARVQLLVVIGAVRVFIRPWPLLVGAGGFHD